jgi:hypothetical protein
VSLVDDHNDVEGPCPLDDQYELLQRALLVEATSSICGLELGEGAVEELQLVEGMLGEQPPLAPISFS